MAFLDRLETQVLAALQTIYDTWGWAGVAALLTFENATGITPSEIILGLAGWMLIAEHQLPASMVFVGGLYAALGSTLGASTAYWAARLGGRPLVDKLTHWFRIPARHIARVECEFAHWGAALVLVGRIIPGVRTLISIPAGLARMNFGKFLLATFIGAYIWCTVLIGAGYIFGHEWELISTYFKQYLWHILIFGTGILALYVLLGRRLVPTKVRVRSGCE